MNQRQQQLVELSTKLLSELDSFIPEKYRDYEIPDREGLVIGDIVSYKSKVGVLVDKSSTKYIVNFNGFGDNYYDCSRIGINNRVHKVKHSTMSDHILEVIKKYTYLNKGGILVNSITGKLYSYPTGGTPVTEGQWHSYPYRFMDEVRTPLSGYDREVLDIPSLSLLESIPELIKAEEERLEKEREAAAKAEAERKIVAAARRVTLEKIVKTVFPDALFGDSSSFNFNSHVSTNSSYSAVVHFPKFTITNEDDHSREITDMYVRFDFTENGILSQEMLGARTTLAIEEYTHRYHHSHLRRSNEGNKWNDFCLGSTDLSMMISQMQSEYRPLMLESVLYRLADYLNWESLDGGPYFNMNDLSTSDNNEGESYAVSFDMIRCHIVPKIKNLPLLLKQNSHGSIAKVDRGNIIFEQQLYDILDYQLEDEAEGERADSYAMYKHILSKTYSDIPIDQSDESSLSDIITGNRSLNQFAPLMIFEDEEYRVRINESNEGIEASDIDTSALVRVLTEDNLYSICKYIDDKLYTYLPFKAIIKEYEQIQIKTTQTEQKEK